MSRFLFWVAAVSSLAIPAWAVTASSDQIDGSTHRQIRVIRPSIDGESVTLHSIATDADGRIVAAVGGNSTTYEVDDEGEYVPVEVAQPAAVLWIDAEGETMHRVDLDITPTAVAVATDGVVYAGGDGQVVQITMDPNGDDEVLAVEVPGLLPEDELRAKAVEAFRQFQERSQTFDFGDQIETLKEKIAAIEEKSEEDRSRLETIQLDAFKRQVDMFESMSGEASESGDDQDASGEEFSEMERQQIERMMDTARGVTSIAVTEADLYVCTSDPGAGYRVHRMDRAMTEASVAAAELVLEDLSGCCGQMDIQGHGNGLAVSENTRFRVALYDRTGELASSFGSRDRTSETGFGSCCNPMNCLPMDDGSILTAESSIGHIKRFDAAGNFVAYIGRAKIGGGCKHCSLGYDAQRDLYFMQSQDENAICVLGNREDYPLTAEELRVAADGEKFLARLAGDWRHESLSDAPEKRSSGGGGILAMLFGGGDESFDDPAIDQLPVARVSFSAGGVLKFEGGQAAMFGDTGRLEVTAIEDAGADRADVILTVDQSEMGSGPLVITGDKIEFETDYFGTVKLVRVTARDGETCDSGGSKCSGADCQDESCACHADQATGAGGRVAATPVGSVPMADDRDGHGVFDEDPPPVVFDPEVLSFQYKLVGVEELGKDREDRLNELGADGWEYVGRLGEKLMFKRVNLESMVGGR